MYLLVVSEIVKKTGVREPWKWSTVDSPHCQLAIFRLISPQDLIQLTTRKNQLAQCHLATFQVATTTTKSPNCLPIRHTILRYCIWLSLKTGPSGTRKNCPRYHWSWHWSIFSLQYRYNDHIWQTQSVATLLCAVTVKLKYMYVYIFGGTFAPCCIRWSACKF